MAQHIFFLLMALAATMVLSVPSDKRAVIIGDNLYFTDTSVERNRSHALAYCVAQGGELAKVNGSIYKVLQAMIPLAGDYWIDGIDKVNADRFMATTDCTDGQIDFAGIPEENLEISASTCLGYRKGPTTAQSRIKAISCKKMLKGVLCSFPLSGCKGDSNASYITGHN